MGLSVAAHFNTPADSERAYNRLTHTLGTSGLKLSAFRFHSDPYWYVAVVGEEDQLPVFVPLAEILARRGTIIPLPDPTHDALLAQRARHLTTPGTTPGFQPRGGTQPPPTR
jgi:hypothetical protein